MISPACLVLFGVALALRLVYFALSYSQLGPDGLWTATYDTQNYASAAQDFLNGTDFAQKYVLMWGPGYPLFLSLFLALWNVPVVALLLVQVLLSAASCLLVAALGHLLVPSRSGGMVAGYLSATSYTSITLASVALPDTLFFFLAALGFYLLISGFQTERMARSVAAAFVLAAGALTKSIAAFWPVLLIAIAIPYLLRAYRVDRSALRRCVVQVAICLSAVLSVQAVLIVRNYTGFGIATISSTLQGGLANIAAHALEEMEGKDFREIRDGWHRDYMAVHGVHRLTPGQMHEADGTEVEKVLRDHPLRFAWAYLRLASENMVAVNQLARVHFPRNQTLVTGLEDSLGRLRTGIWWVVLSVSGALVLLVRRAYPAFWVLLALYGYYALLVAATRWQGSRLSYPSELSGSVLIAVAFVAVIGWGQKRFLRRSSQSGLPAQ